MKIKRLIACTCLMLLVSGCASMDEAKRLAAIEKSKLGHPILLDFLATAKAGDKLYVIDTDKDNEEGTAIIRDSYLAASGKACRAYYWLQADSQQTTGPQNLNVACQAATGTWRKIRTLSNIGVLLEEEPVGYVLH